MKISLSQYWKSTVKCFAVVVIALYIKLWFTKIDDNDMEENSSHDSQSNTKEQLTVLTYNMWCNYLVKAGEPNYIKRFEGFANGVKDLDVDIIFVQEIFIFRVGPLEFSNCATEMVDILRSKGFKYRTSITDTVPYFFGQTNGVAIFSKFPLNNKVSEVFKDAGVKERVNNKGFVSADVMVNGKKIVLFTAHTDAHVESIRTLQLKQVLTAVKKHPNSHIILGGDLNINPHNPPADGNKKEYDTLLKTMNNAGLQSVFSDCEKTHYSGGCYDHLFVSSKVKVREKKIINLMTDKGEMVSDHFGLLMKIKLPDEK